MKTSLLICIAAALTLFCGVMSAQTETWQWASSAGGDQDEAGTCITTDTLGNSYVAGTFADTTSFGSDTLVSYGDSDIFIAKADAGGNWLWARQAGGLEGEFVNSIALDSTGNVLITGSFYETAVLGQLSLTAAGNYDIFVAKLDPAGTWLWASSAGGTSYEEARDIAADDDGNAIITGAFLESAVFGSSMVISSGSFDIYAAKINSSGTWLWSTHAGGDGSDYGTSIALDNPGNIYLTGCFSYYANFGDFGFESIGNHDIFAAKLDEAGTWLWVQHAGGMSDDWGQKIAVDANANIFVGGTYRDDADFGEHNLSGISNSYPEVFIAKMNSAGLWQWARQAGGFDIIAVSELAVDDNSNLYVSGYFRGNAYLGALIHFSQGDYDIYFAKLNTEGNWLKVLLGGGLGSDRSFGMCAQNNTLYLTGSFNQTAQFGEHSLTSAGMGDVFIARIAPYTPVDDDILPPSQPFLLSQNYPNPFNPSTTIALNVSSSRAKYTLSVFDIRGRKIATLLDGWLEPGAHQVIWNGVDEDQKPLPSGVYLYRLDTADGSETRRMILCK